MITQDLETLDKHRAKLYKFKTWDAQAMEVFKKRIAECSLMDFWQISDLITDAEGPLLENPQQIILANTYGYDKRDRFLVDIVNDDWELQDFVARMESLFKDEPFHRRQLSTLRYYLFDFKKGLSKGDCRRYLIDKLNYDLRKAVARGGWGDITTSWEVPDVKAVYFDSGVASQHSFSKVTDKIDGRDILRQNTVKQTVGVGGGEDSCKLCSRINFCAQGNIDYKYRPGDRGRIDNALFERVQTIYDERYGETPIKEQRDTCEMTN